MRAGRDLLTALDDGTLPPAEFNHANHIRAAWYCLNTLPLRIAAHAFREVLEHYVTRVGAQDKFHLTLTYAFMHLIRERIKDSSGDWDRFVADNPDLFDNAQALVGRYYSPGRLMSAEARRQFLEPDLAALPG